MQTKFNFSSGGEFLRSNSQPFSGYFNITDGNAYEGRYYTPESPLLLNPISEYSSDYYKSSNFKDRYIFDEIKLQYSLEEILIQPNEIVGYSILNKKIEYLHSNLIYTYSQMFMGSTDVPVDGNVNTLCILVGTSAFGWETKPPNRAFGFSPLSSVPNLSAYKEFDVMKKFVVIPYLDESGIGIFGITNTHLIGLSSRISETGQLSGAAFTFYTNVIDNYSDEACKNLSDITFDGKYLYISDSKINEGGQVFKYDVTGYYTGDSVFENKRFLIEPIGGSGAVDRRSKFNGCTVLGSKPNEIWVYDSGNSAIKIYDDNFVWKRTLKIPKSRKYSVLDIRHREMNNHIYVLFSDSYDPSGMQYGLFEYDENYLLINTYVFEDFLFPDTDGQFNRMAISKQDSNVFYVITNNSVFKKFFSKPEKTFAVFNREKFYPDDLFIWSMIDRNWESLADFETWNYAEFFTINLTTHDIYIAASSQNKDDLYFMGDTYISHLNERTDYLSLLKQDNIPYYNFERIRFENVEYNQGLVINKEIYKIYQNIIQFKNNLKGKFYAEFDKFGDLLYKDYIHFIDEEINTLEIEIEYNSFVNDNELVQPNVINRLFKKIYNFQINLMNLTNVKLKNFKTWVDLKGGSNIYPIA
jgi:hypothetical protein